MKEKWLLGVAVLLLFIIASLSLWASAWGTYCKGDGCIGIYFLYAVSIMFLLIQVFVVLPLYGASLRRSGQSWHWSCARWRAVSIAAVFVPMVIGLVIAHVNSMLDQRRRDEIWGRNSEVNQSTKKGVSVPKYAVGGDAL